jgi:hypothetical protein
MKTNKKKRHIAISVHENHCEKEDGSGLRIRRPM